MTNDDKLSLLIVEDDSNFRYLLEAAAERTGEFHPIVSMPDGRAAWDYLKSLPPGRHPELIVSDLSMPHMTGTELVRAVKNDPALHNIRIGIITSSDQPHDRDEALDAGACSFLRKPLRFDEFMSVLLHIRHSCGERV